MPTDITYNYFETIISIVTSVVPENIIVNEITNSKLSILFFSHKKRFCTEFHTILGLVNYNIFESAVFREIIKFK